MVRLAWSAALSLAACGGRAAAPAAPAPVPYTAVDELADALRAGDVTRYYDGDAGVDLVDLLAASYQDDGSPWALHLCGARGAEAVRVDTALPRPDDASWSCAVEGAAALEVRCALDADGEFTPNVELYLRGAPLRLAHIVRTPNGVLGHDWAVEAANAIAQLPDGCSAEP